MALPHGFTALKRITFADKRTVEPDPDDLDSTDYGIASVSGQAEARLTCDFRAERDTVLYGPAPAIPPPDSPPYGHSELHLPQVVKWRGLYYPAAISLSARAAASAHAEWDSTAADGSLIGYYGQATTGIGNIWGYEIDAQESTIPPLFAPADGNATIDLTLLGHTITLPAASSESRYENKLGAPGTLAPAATLTAVELKIEEEWAFEGA